MGAYVDLLRSLPKTRRDVSGRKGDKSQAAVYIAKKFGADYFDGARKYGYGGFFYDGRWQSVARDILEHYFSDVCLGGLLEENRRILDVGCAKGFLVSDLLGRGADAYGIDISRYAIVEQLNFPLALIGRLHLGSADSLPFPDKSFDLVLSINTLHNLPRPRLITALQEMRRVSRGGMFVQVDSYRTPEEKARFEDWVLTAETHGNPDFWQMLFSEAGYDGDYAWTIVEES